MNASRIKSLVLQDFYITRREYITRLDLPFFSFTNLAVLGHISLFLAGGIHSTKGQVLIIGILLWEVARLSQYLVCTHGLFNLWSHNLSNLFIAPLSIVEYATGSILAAVWKVFTLFVTLCIIAKLMYGFAITSIGVPMLLLTIIDLLLFGCAVGLIILGTVFRFGLRSQSLAWAGIFIIQPIVGVYFPVSVLPRWLQIVAHFVPITYVFDGVHNALSGSGATVGLGLIGLGLNCMALVVGLLVFNKFYNESRVSGQFARNDS